MKKEELAKKLHGREYMSEITKAEAAEAKASGLVVAFGASDDLLEFRGAIDDEIGAYNGTVMAITPEGLLVNQCTDENCPYFAKISKATKETVTAIWANEGDEYSWRIESTLPFAPFDIMEDGEKYCRGIVFKMPSAEMLSFKLSGL